MVSTRFLTPKELLYELELYGMMSYRQARKLKNKTILSHADLNSWAWRFTGQSLPKVTAELDTLRLM